MAQYEIMYWKEFPAQVRATESNGTQAKAMLPDRFSQAIDAAAMVEQSVDADAYLAGWEWSAPDEREGTAQDVVDAVVDELDRAFPQERLRQMIRSRQTD